MNNGRFKKGQPAWNKGMNNPWMKGKKRPDKVCKKISEARKRLGLKPPIPYKRANNVEIICETCQIVFKVPSSRKDKAKFCSKECYIKSKKGKVPAGVIKGNFVSNSYDACHYKIRSLRGTPSLCELCGTTKSLKFEWANLTGDYENIYDYKRMCCKCHRNYDNKRRKERQTQIDNMVQESLNKALMYMQETDPLGYTESREADRTIWAYRTGYEEALKKVSEAKRVLSMTISCIDNSKYSNVCTDIKKVLEEITGIKVTDNDK